RRRRTATAALRRPARRAFYRSGSLRRLVAGARWPGLREELPDLAHLTLFKETADGPVQRDEALLLHPMIRVIRPRAVLEIGTMPRSLVPRGHWWFHTAMGGVGDEREVEPDERAFVNWLLAKHPEFSQIHMHSRHTLRCGITLLQRSAPLARPSVDQRDPADS